MEPDFLSDDSALRELLRIDSEIVDLHGVGGVLAWDQEVNMPPRGIELRAKQFATLAGIMHQREVNPRVGELLSEVESRLNQDPERYSLTDRAFLREMRRDYDRATKLTQDLVQKLAESAARATASWQKAKEDNDFALFRPNLEQLLELVLEKAEQIGYRESPYDVLLDEHEVGATESWVRKIFTPLREKTVEILKKIESSPVQLHDRVLHGDFAWERQQPFIHEVLEWLGYDFEAGRLDLSSHPFTINFGGPQDVRITTRVRSDRVDYALMPSIHETGHAIYEQNTDRRFARSRLSGGISLGIHESQSRFFENQIARNRAFWRYWYPRLQAVFTDQLAANGLEDWYHALNIVRPSLIRVEADEVSYNLHIILRFEIESDLLHRRIQVRDLPEIWRERMREYLGVVPETDREGVLQDIHWSHGSFGYFPTYTLGNLYAAQFAQVMREQLDVDTLLGKGEFSPIRTWLIENIHQWGKVYLPDELCLRVSGERLNAQHFLDYVGAKFGQIYGF